MTQRFFLGFEVHQPYHLKKQFVPGKTDSSYDPMGRYFDGANKETLLRVCDKCYDPATSIILDQLDDGFSCAFSISGVLIEQLERWAPDVLDLFVQAAGHPNVEMIGQTYFYSIASLFWTMEEFCDQVNLHRELVKDIFGVEPTIFENTDLILDNCIATTARELGYNACLTEGVDHILQWRSPNYLYQCAGIPVIMRNSKLSDDIAFRFTCQDWNEWPLTADRYANWVSKTPGDFVPVFIHYETLGEHYCVESGILEFLRYLGPEMRRADVTMIKPSEILSCVVRDEFSIQFPISRTDAEKEGITWGENWKHKTAFRAVQRAKAFCENRHTWRCLQTCDHFYHMDGKHGSCNEIHSYFNHQPEHEVFITYMNVLADFEEHSLETMENKNYLFPIRSLPVDDAFYFSSPIGLTGHVAFDLDQFSEMLQIVPADSIDFHQRRGDFAFWCRNKIGDEPRAAAIEQAKTRQELILATNSREHELWTVPG